MERKRILVADDEPKIVKFLHEFLSREGFEVTSVSNGEEAVSAAAGGAFDLIILDIMMPVMDGYEACRRIRDKADVPIIMLSAKNEPIDRVMGLTVGSDDYLAKPFDTSELLLRVKAVLKRTAGRPTGESEDHIALPGLSIDRATRSVEVDGREVELTPKEFELLWLLAGHPKRVFTRNQLLYQVWNTDYTGDTGLVTTLVKRLREKIEQDPSTPVFVKTVRGVGYKFGVVGQGYGPR